MTLCDNTYVDDVAPMLFKTLYGYVASQEIITCNWKMPGQGFSSSKNTFLARAAARKMAQAKKPIQSRLGRHNKNRAVRKQEKQRKRERREREKERKRERGKGGKREREEERRQERERERERKREERKRERGKKRKKERKSERKRESERVRERERE